MKRVINIRAGALAGFLALLFLVYFAATVFLYFLHEEGLFRFEFGAEDTKAAELVFDRNRVLELYQREKAIETKEKAYRKSMEEVEGLKRQLSLQRDQLLADKEYLTKKMDEIASKFDELNAEEEKRLKELAGLYAKMKPTRVATIFNVLEVETVAKLLTRMQNKSSAKILGIIGTDNPDRAAMISNIIQGKLQKELFNGIT